MEGYILYVLVALLFAGTLSSDVHDDNTGLFRIPKEAFNLSTSPTTSVTVNETVTTVLSLNETTPGNSSESETTTRSMQELKVNPTTQTTEHTTETEIEETTLDQLVTDSTGCLVNLKNKIEDGCHDRFEQTVISLHDEENNGGVCCALEDYEKCALNGYKRSNCQIDQKELKKLLGTARIFAAAMSEVNCAEYKAQCNSGATVIHPFSLILTAVPVFLLLL
ncbi:uncharacterized protein [Parasteatoda tepidariorum]|uniref:uncharacterized protein isoform X1 n=1 Tax=Parasteatoda tepidariorum TaxID=114398 RepID=UPI00077F9F1D|nr:uncharacterized protein LOC107455642 [Parasteatoda tepidariorum]